jgi:hypothetical protein
VTPGKRRKGGGKERGCVGAGASLLYGRMEVGDGTVGCSTWQREAWGGGGGWRGARAALSAGSGPPVAGAGGQHVRVGLVLNRGEAGG